jgi:hypothetical protein
VCVCVQVIVWRISDEIVASRLDEIVLQSSGNNSVCTRWLCSWLAVVV